MKLERIGLIGYGEVGKIFCAGLLKQPGVTGVGAWDLKFAQPATQATELSLIHISEPTRPY